MLTGIHFLLSYACTYECDHCFLYCSPEAEGTFTINQIRDILTDGKKIDNLEWIFFEGGEPFLYYPIMLEGLRMARSMDYKTGVVTNCYWANSVEDARVWLEPLLKTGVDELSLSDDEFHHGETQESPGKIAARAAVELGMPSSSICIEKPTVQPPAEGKGDPVIGGGALFKGRAVEKLTNGLPTKPAGSFPECIHEELVAPKRAHIDSFGNVQVCQGLSIGNIWKKPLSEIMNEYDVANHPICAPLERGGPDELAKSYGVKINGGFVDECHYCFLVRRALIDKFPEHLTPRQVYGLKD